MKAVASRNWVWTRFPIVLALAAIAATAPSSANPAASEVGSPSQTCRATLRLEEVVVARDTDPFPPWEPADRWTFHTRAYMMGHLGKFDSLMGFVGDTGYVKPVNSVLIKRKDVGKAGDQILVRIDHMAKERDLKNGKIGVFPRDQGELGFKHTEECRPGTFAFSSFVDVLAQPAPPDPQQEHDGQLEFRWTLTFEIE